MTEKPVKPRRSKKRMAAIIAGTALLSGAGGAWLSAEVTVSWNRWRDEAPRATLQIPWGEDPRLVVQYRRGAQDTLTAEGMTRQQLCVPGDHTFYNTNPERLPESLRRLYGLDDYLGSFLP